MQTKYPDIAVVDIETTAKDPNRGHIVEIGIVLLNTKTGAITPLLDTPVREADDIDWNAWIFGHSTLTPEMVRDGPTWAEVQPRVQEIFAKYPVTAFNKSFDLTALRRKGIKVWQEEACIMLASTPVCCIPKRGPWREDDPWKWPSALEAWDYFFPTEFYGQKHRALDDAIHEARILWALLQLK